MLHYTVVFKVQTEIPFLTTQISERPNMEPCANVVLMFVQSAAIARRKLRHVCNEKQLINAEPCPTKNMSNMLRHFILHLQKHEELSFIYIQGLS